MAPPNRIREFRKASGLTGAQLAERIGVSQAQLSKLESGKRPLMPWTLDRLSMALGKSVPEIQGYDSGRPSPVLVGFADELVPYVADAADPLHNLQGGNQYLYTVTTDACDLAGIPKGSIVAVSDEAERCKNPAPLSIVRVRLHPRDNFMKPLTLLRQFVPPRLLITNSSVANELSIDMSVEDAHIVGVVISAHRTFQG